MLAFDECCAMVAAMGTAGVISAGKQVRKPASGRRLTAVEREILRCVEVGEAADFTTGQWPGRKGADGKPAVTGKFLSDLWLGLFDIRVHPRGIEIKGLAVQGEIDLGGARVDARMRTPLVGLMVSACHFDSCVRLSNARVEALFFEDCIFATADATGGNIFAGSTEVIGQFHVTNCTLNSYLSLRNAVIDDDLMISGGTFARSIRFSGAEIRGNVSLTGLKVDGMADGSGVAIECVDAVIAGNVAISRCHFNGAVAWSQTQSASLVFKNVVVTGQVNALYIVTTQKLWMQRCRFRQGADFSGSVIGGQIYCVRSLVGSADSAQSGLKLASARVAIFVIIGLSRINGGLELTDLDAGQKLALLSLSVPMAGANRLAVDATRLKAGRLEVTNARIGGQLLLTDARLGGMTIDRCTFDLCSGGARHSGGAAVEAQAYGLNAYGARFERDAIVATTRMDGGATFQSVLCGGQMVVRNCWLGNSTRPHSFHAWNMVATGLVEFTDSLLPAGLYVPNLQTADLRLNSVICCAPDSGAGQYMAVSLQAARVTDSCSFGRSEGEGSPPSRFFGSIHAGDAELLTSLYFANAHLHQPPGTQPAGWAGGLSFAGARLGDVCLGSEADDAQLASIAGCIACDRASIKSLRLYKSLNVHSRSKDGIASFRDGEADDVTRNKWGVALSLLAVTIERGLTVAGAQLNGMVDLKNLSVNSVLDQGGAAWAKAGVLPGQLRLDGFTYADLDDDQAASNELATAGGSTARPKGAVARRLDWLDMQYPNHQASAATFVPQPFEQLARHYGAMGDERGRRQVLIRKRQLQRLHSGLGWVERLVSGLLGLTSNYGYSPGRASLWALMLILLGTAGAALFDSAGAMVQRDISGGPMSFSALLYAIDVAVPFVDLGHDSAWRIDPARLTNWPGRTFIVQLSEAVYRLSGVVILSITVLTFSGVLREKD